MKANGGNVVGCDCGMYNVYYDENAYNDATPYSNGNGNRS